MDLDQIIETILKLSEKEGHPDKVSCIHAVLISVNQMIGREMLKIRNGERNKSKCLEKLL